MPDIFQPEQVLILVAFLGGLVLLWWIVVRNRDGLALRINRDKRLRLIEATALGPADRAMILAVDNREFLVLRLKGAAPIVQTLDGAPVVTGAAV